jgi:hypothetical protein
MEIVRLRNRIHNLEAAMKENCKHRLVGITICGYYNDGPRYRQKCILTDCPAVETEEGKVPESK